MWDGRLARYLLGPTPTPSQCVSETNQREKEKQRILFIILFYKIKGNPQVSHEMYHKVQ